MPYQSDLVKLSCSDGHEVLEFKPHLVNISRELADYFGQYPDAKTYNIDFPSVVVNNFFEIIMFPSGTFILEPDNFLLSIIDLGIRLRLNYNYERKLCSWLSRALSSRHSFFQSQLSNLDLGQLRDYIKQPLPQKAKEYTLNLSYGLKNLNFEINDDSRLVPLF